MQEIESDHEAFVRELCRAMAGSTVPECKLNLISLLTSGLMTWTTNNRSPLDFESAKGLAADLVLQATTAVMVKITELTLDDDVCH